MFGELKSLFSINSKFFLVSSLVLSLASCGGGGSDKGGDNNSATPAPSSSSSTTGSTSNNNANSGSSAQEDTQAPTISLTANTTLFNQEGDLQLMASVDDDTGVTKVEFFQNDELTPLATVTTSPYQFARTIYHTNNGTLSFRATAFDSAGNRTSSSIQIDVNIPAPVFAKCSNIDALPLNIWEKIDPPGIGAHAVEADPLHPGRVYAGADLDDHMEDDIGVGMYRSDDCGANWYKISTGDGDAALQTGRLWSIVFHPSKPDVMYTTSGYGAYGWWRSKDGGINWENITPKAGDNLTDGSPLVYTGFISSAMVDPLDGDHMYLTYHASCENPGVESVYGCLAETRNGGDTWTILTRANPPYIPEVRAYPLGGNRFAVNHASLNEVGHPVSDLKMQFTDNGGQTFTDVLDRMMGGHDWNVIYHSSNGYHYLGAAYALARISPDGTVWDEVLNESQHRNVVGDGNKLFVSTSGGLYTSDETNPQAPWTKVATDQQFPAHTLTLDPVNKLLYMIKWNGGPNSDFYRLRYE